MTVLDYEQMLEDFYTTLLTRGDVCIDVGAHVGRHTLPIARCIKPHGKVFGFEPIPAIFQQLYSKIDTSPDLASVVRLRQCALADVAGSTDFVLVHEAPGYSGLRRRHYDFAVSTETIRVDVLRLDDMLREIYGVRYIKIDCEGGELGVLRGASNLLRRDRPVISFECGDSSLGSYDYDAGDLFDFLDSRGYDIRSITDVPLDRSGFVAASARQEYWDYLAFPRTS